MHLANHRIAGNAAKLFGDLAGAQAFSSELFQHFHAFIGARD